MKIKRSFNRYLNLTFLRHRLLFLLVALLMVLTLFPLLQESFPEYLLIMDAFLTVLLFAGVTAVSAKRELLMIALLIALLAFTVMWFNAILQTPSLLIFGLCTEILYFLFATVIILRHVLSFRRVTADKIYGAICVYLLIGVIWALANTVLELVSPGAFHFTHQVDMPSNAAYAHPAYFMQFIYYSFVTLSTLGYGDITPLSNAARMFSSVEAVIGQLYVAVLIARLVGLQISHAHNNDS